MNAHDVNSPSAPLDAERPEASDDRPPAPAMAEHHSHQVRLDELAIPALLAVIGAYLVFGLGTMEIPKTAVWPKPDFFPMIVTILIFVVAAVLTVQTLVGYRRTRSQTPPEGSLQPRTDWKAFGTVIAAFLVFAATLLPLGWIVAGTLLFWGVARALGSRRVVFDLLLALGASAFVQLAFSAGLGLRLPPGIFGWF